MGGDLRIYADQETPNLKLTREPLRKPRPLRLAYFGRPFERIAVSMRHWDEWMTEAGIWISRRNARNGFSSRVAGATALAYWCRSTGRITVGSRTAAPNAPCSSISTMPPESFCICVCRIGGHVRLSAATKAYLQQWGKPLAFYSDKHGVFRSTHP